jgi:hypothetical protein
MAGKNAFSDQVFFFSATYGKMGAAGREAAGKPAGRHPQAMNSNPQLRIS